MPKLRKNDLNEMKFVSIADLYKNLDRFESLDDKLRYATRYLLNYEISADDSEYAYARVVEAARQKIAEAAAKSTAPKGKDVPDYIVDKEVEDEKDDLAAELFLSDPAAYLKGEAEKAAKEIDDDDINFQWQTKLKENCEKIIPKMDQDFTDKVIELDKNSTFFGVKARLEANLGGRKAVDDLYAGTQPKGFFSRLFDTSSREWGEVERAYEVFNNPVKNGFGNMEMLEEAANDYLKHKFPDWNPGQEVPAEAYSKLNDVEMAKVNFSIGLLNALDEQKQVEGSLHSLVAANKDRGIQYSDIPQGPKARHIDFDELEFQEQVKDDVEESFHLLKDSEEVENENEKIIDEEELSDDEDLIEEVSVSK